MMKEIFVTATDTDAGKTFVSSALIHALTQYKKTEEISPSEQKLSIAAYKPVAAGCELVDGKLINEDAQLLSQFANAGQTICNVNPITFKEAIAPHIAARKHNQKITLDEISENYKKVKEFNADITLTEGAGGWRLPLGKEVDELGNSTNHYLSDFVRHENLQVILIVNMKLGCLNHALLTYEAIIRDGLKCIAWVANSACKDAMDNLEENIAELEQLLPMPKMAELNYIADIDKQGKAISLPNKIELASKVFDLDPILNLNH